uniref:Secreted protein n=1 Tax=Solanum tuberosum TaxID=4113 RepID=M1CPA9_SOLTU
MAVAISLLQPARLRHHQSPHLLFFSLLPLFFSDGGAAAREPAGVGRLRSFFPVDSTSTRQSGQANPSTSSAGESSSGQQRRCSEQ